RLASPPGSFYLAADLLWNERTKRTKIWRIRPRRTSAKNWSPKFLQGTHGQPSSRCMDSVWENCKEFLDRRMALDHAAGKRAEVSGARAQGSGPIDGVRIGV